MKGNFWKLDVLPWWYFFVLGFSLGGIFGLFMTLAILGLKKGAA